MKETKYKQLGIELNFEKTKKLTAIKTLCLK